MRRVAERVCSPPKGRVEKGIDTSVFPPKGTGAIGSTRRFRFGFEMISKVARQRIDKCEESRLVYYLRQQFLERQVH